MRLHALKKGWSLNEHGMTRVIKTEEGASSKLENMPAETDEQVFNLLGLKYRKPEERSV